MSGLAVELAGGLARIDGGLLFFERTATVGYNEAVEVVGDDGRTRLGRVAAVDEERIVVELLESTTGLALATTRVRLLGEPLKLAVGPGMLGRTFNGVGEAIDGGPPVAAAEMRRVEGLAIKPVARAAPSEFIETGITAIDLLDSLVRGQKLPIFSGGGLPHDQIAIDIVCHARLAGSAERATDGGSGEGDAAGFAICFAGIGIPHDTAERFRWAMEQSGAAARTLLFLNLASDPPAQRLLAPRVALTAAEYLAFTEGRHVLVVLTDMTNYCEALREVSAGHGEIPSRKGYPGYLYSDLASLYERAGRIRGLPGSLTQIPILTMPGDDMSHPIPDLTGYITEGQIVLDRDLARRSLYPPVKVLSSLSRLMKEGTGAGFTHADHPALATQLYASYARAVQARVLASVVGEEGVSEIDRGYLHFGDTFESKVIAQTGPRSLAESMAAGWNALRLLPGAELHRLSGAQIAAHLGPTAGGGK